MKIPYNTVQAHRLYDAVRVSRHLEINAAHWTAEVERIRKVIEQAHPPFDELISTLLEVQRDSCKAMRESMEVVTAGRDPAERPPTHVLEWLREAVIYSLGMQGAEAAEALIRRFRREKEGSVERYWLMAPLMATGAPQAADLFRNLADAEVTSQCRSNERLQRWALEPIWEQATGGEFVPPPEVDPAERRATLLQALQIHRDQLEEYWAQSPEEREREEYETILRDLQADYHLTRARAVEGLAEHDGPGSIPTIRKYLQDENEWVREAAQRALERL